MLRSLLTVGLLFAGTPTFATEWVHCADAGGAASFDFLSGDGIGVLSIVGLTITAGDKVWASAEAYGPGDPVSVGQQFEDADSVRVDAMDKDVAKIAELRLFRASEGDTYVTAGTLRIIGMGAWAVACEGP